MPYRNAVAPVARRAYRNDISVEECPRAFPFDGNAKNGSAQGRSPAQVIWQPGESLGSGIYLVRAHFDRLSDRGDESVTKRVVYLK